jgi:preprotein translocase subunit SecY
VPNPGIFFIAMCMLTFTTGTAFIMWIGEQISENGIGNGMSLIIFTGIVARMPSAVMNLFKLTFVSKQLDPFRALILVFLLVGVVAGAILVTTGQRRIPVQYPRQVKGRRVSGGQRTYLPLRVNQAGVIPIIFASSILSLPASLSSTVRSAWLEPIIRFWFVPGSAGYMMVYAALIVFFGFFYTAITFNPVEMADQMKKYGGVIIGVRPGKATADYLNHIMGRITLSGSVFLAAIALLPEVVYLYLNVPDWTIVQFFGGTSLLILVGVALDTIKQIEQHLIMRHYEGFSSGRGGRIRARRG